MKHLATIVIVFLYAAVVAQGEPKATEQIRFVTTHFSDLRNEVFALPAGRSASYYLSPVVGLQISAVYVDGVSVTSMPVRGSDIEPGLEYYEPVLTETMIYQVPVSQIWTLKSLDKLTGHMAIEEYAVPMDARRVEIYYRVRYPQNRVSPEMLFISVLKEEFKARK
ncbi:MAG: hypothetical protein QM715_01280 [Nibricoccus sp.]